MLIRQGCQINKQTNKQSAKKISKNFFILCKKMIWQLLIAKKCPKAPQSLNKLIFLQNKH